MSNSIDPKHRAKLLEIARHVDEQLNGQPDGATPEFSFVIIVNEFGTGDGVASYISNLHTKPLAAQMNTFAARLRRLPA